MSGLMVSYLFQWAIIHYHHYLLFCSNSPRFGSWEPLPLAAGPSDSSASFSEHVLAPGSPVLTISPGVLVRLSPLCSQLLTTPFRGLGPSVQDLSGLKQMPPK